MEKKNGISGVGKGMRRSITRWIKTLEESPIDSDRWESARSLGQIVGKKDVEPLVKVLIKTLGDRNWDVRWCAARSLGWIGDKRGVEPLVKALLRDEYWKVRLHCARSLGRIGDKRGIEPLITKVLTRHTCPEVRSECIYSLGLIGDKLAVEPLIKVLAGDENWKVRLEAAKALGYIDDKRAVEPLVKALDDESAGARWNSAVALGQIGDSRAIEPLLNCCLGEKFWYAFGFGAINGALGDIYNKNKGSFGRYRGLLVATILGGGAHPDRCPSIKKIMKEMNKKKELV